MARGPIHNTVLDEKMLDNTSLRGHSNIRISEYEKQRGVHDVPDLYVPPRGDFDVSVSPALAMTLTLPLVELAPKYPGVDPWLVQLYGRLGRAVRADIRLLCVPLSGALAYMLDVPTDEESLQPALDALRQATAEEVYERVVGKLAVRAGSVLYGGKAGAVDPADVSRWIREEPERIQKLIAAMDGPSAEERFAIDAQRAVALLADPAEMKRLIEFRLHQLWHDHFAPRWREVLPTARALAKAARSQFHLSDPERVMHAVVGRSMHEYVSMTPGMRIVFCPVPFLGPYVSTASSERNGAQTVFVGFGIARGADHTENPTPRELLAALRALADEARLNVIAHVREHGRTCAAELMERFQWSQPATSRHLRALESVGLLDVERVDGVKWYTINTSHARRIVGSLERFLAKE